MYVYDYHNSTLLIMANQIDIYIGIDCIAASDCSGNTTSPVLSKGTIISGVFTINNFKILSSGQFNISVTQSNMLSAFFITEDINNYVKTITTIASPSIIANFDTIISVDLIGDDDFTYILPVNVSISDNSIMNSTLYNSANNGSTSFSLWFTKPGTINPVISIVNQSLKKTITLNVLKDKLKATGLFPVPKTNLDKFSLNVSVCSSNDTIIEKSHGPYNISLTLNPPGTIIPSYIMTINGTANFNLIITTYNTYEIIISSPNMDSLTTISFTIVDVLTNFTLVNSLTQPLNTVIPLTIQLLNNYNKLFLSNTLIELSCTDIISIDGLSKYTMTGSVIFNGYFITNGTKNCTVKSRYTTTVLKFSININNKANTDPKCYIASNNTDCYICVNNSVLDNNNVCQCITNSYYNFASGQCECFQGFSYVNGFCIKCANYFASNEITANYAKDYKSIIFTFDKQVAGSASFCDGIASLPKNLTSLNPTCM